MWAYAHMIFQNHSILPTTFLGLEYYERERQRAFIVASDIIAAKHMKEDK